MPREPALPTSGAMDGEAQSASSDRRPGWPQGVSGDGAWAAPTPQGHLPGAPTGLQPRVASARASVGAK
jgi:hypothetical protein